MNMQTSNQESQIKLSRVRNLLDQFQVDGLVLRRVGSFAWMTCGASSQVNTASTEGAAALLITREQCYLTTNNIEAPRLKEESGLAEQGWELIVSPWHNPQKGLNELADGLSLAADVPFLDAKDASADVARLRSNLTPMEGERFKLLGKLSAQAMHAALLGVKPGMSEEAIAGLLSDEAFKRGLQPIVNLVAVDERVSLFRHPLPTHKKLEQYAMLVLCARKWGLVCSLTRLVHFGRLSAELRERSLACAQVNANLIAHTQPKRTLGEILDYGQLTYASLGYPDEWQTHHQGGLAGYEPREFLAVPGSQEMVSQGQALAWNPSITGTKVEDTVLVGEAGNQVITQTPSLPNVRINDIPCSLVLEII
jgi:Xaa-Pro aminopeptidase